MEDLKQKARKDFESSNLKKEEWVVFWMGYVAAIKRFGANNAVD